MSLTSAAQAQPSVALDRLLQAVTSLGLPMSEPEARRLLDYLALLERWNKVYNLTALREPEQMFSHHLLDCLSTLPALDRGLRYGPTAPIRVLDVGSGGGLPGVVLAILRPHWEVHCVDAVAKKAGFIRQVALELQLSNLRAMHARVETLEPRGRAQVDGRGPGYQLVTSRAFASLSDFVHLTRAMLAVDGVWAAMKATLTPKELAEVPPTVDVFHVEQLQVPGLDAQRCLVWMRPRAPAA